MKTGISIDDLKPWKAFGVFLGGLAFWFCQGIGIGPSAWSQPAWPTITLTPVAAGLLQPTSITHAGDNSPRIFVTEKTGRVRIIKNGALLHTPFLDIADRIGSTPGAEQGLLSVAFPPGYGSLRNRFYVFYTNATGSLVVARFG